MRVIGFLCFWVLLVVFGCRKALVQPVAEKVEKKIEEKIEEKKVEEPPKPEPPKPESPKPPEPEPPKPLFRIGDKLGVRGSVCEDGTCEAVALEVKGNSDGLVEGIILNAIVLRDNALVIGGGGLAENLSGWWGYSLFKSRKAIIGIPLILENPDEAIQELTFKVEVEGAVPAMQIGVYNGLQGKRKGLKNLKGFTRTNAFEVQPAVKAVQGTYYILLHLSLGEVKGMYDKITKDGSEIRFKVTGTAKDYPEEVKTIEVRLER